MRVLLIHNRYRSGSPGGEDVVFEQERLLLEKAGFEVSAYTRDNDEIVGPLGQRLGAAFSLLSSARTRSDLRALIAERRPNVVHVHNLFPLIGPDAYLVCKRAGIPVVQTVHNYRLVCASANHFRSGRVCTECTADSHRPALRHRCYRNSMVGTAFATHVIRRTWQIAVRDGNIARFIVLTKFASDWLAGQGVPIERISIKPNFVDKLLMRPPEVEGYALFAGRLSEEKGLGNLLAAWRNLRDVPLRLVGDGPMRQWIERYVAQHDLPVEIMGMRSRAEVRGLIAAASCLVFPSTWFEGMPMVLLEAMESGTPVVATRIGGIPEILVDRDLHSLVSPESPEELSVAIRDMISRRATRAPDFPRSYSAPSVYSPSRAVEMLDGIYRSAISDFQRA